MPSSGPSRLGVCFVFWVLGLGFIGFRVLGLGFRVYRVLGLGFRVEVDGFRVTIGGLQEGVFRPSRRRLELAT